MVEQAGNTMNVQAVGLAMIFAVYGIQRSDFNVTSPPTPEPEPSRVSDAAEDPMDRLLAFIG